MQPFSAQLRGRGRGKQPWLVAVAGKLVETILQLRVDVKKNQTDCFQSVLSQIQRPMKYQPESPMAFLAELVPKDLYNVPARLQPSPSSNYCVNIELILLNKKTQLTEIVQYWQLRFGIDSQQPSSAYSPGSAAQRGLMTFFEELVELLARLPFWKGYWQDNDKRRVNKTTHLLNYRLTFATQRFPITFEYEEKHQMVRQLPGLCAKLTVYTRSSILSLRVPEGSEKSEATRASSKPMAHKVSSSSGGSIKRHSFYSYEDEELDVTIISSDTDLSPSSSGIEPVEFVFEQQDCSDDEMVIVLESEEDNRRQHFQQALAELRARADLEAESAN